MAMDSITRRRFLSAAAAGGVLYAFGRTPGIAVAQAAGGSGQFSDYKALVCVFLVGGNDSWNMVVPTSATEYATYASTRQNMAIAQASLLPISPLVSDGATYGFHPSMPGAAALFNQGQLAVVANLGPLITPTTKAQYQAQSVPLPPQLFSHLDQQNQWHSLQGKATLKTGWAGRIADLLAAATTSQTLPLNLSLAGQTFYEAGASTVPYVMGTTGPVAFAGLGTSGTAAARRQSFLNIANATYGTAYERVFAQVEQRALQYANEVNQAIASAPSLAALPDNPPAGSTLGKPLSLQLRTVAKLIASRAQLNVQRQVFFVALGGFDTHDNQLADQPGLLDQVSTALQAFYEATVELGVSQSVVTFTESDFARTLTSNGDGTDHAWGGLHLVVGGAVKGQTIYGHYPSMQIGGPLDVGAGRLIPDFAVDQYAATLARWFGVAASDLPSVCPSLGNFVQQDMGFLSS